MLLYKKPQDAIALYKKSLEINEKLGNLRAVSHAARQINYIKRYNKMFDK